MFSSCGFLGIVNFGTSPLMTIAKSIYMIVISTFREAIQDRKNNIHKHESRLTYEQTSIVCPTFLWRTDEHSPSSPLPVWHTEYEPSYSTFWLDKRTPCRQWVIEHRVRGHGMFLHHGLHKWQSPTHAHERQFYRLDIWSLGMRSWSRWGRHNSCQGVDTWLSTEIIIEMGTWGGNRHVLHCRLRYPVLPGTSRELPKSRPRS